MLPLDISSLKKAYSSGDLTPAEVIRSSYAQIRTHEDKAVWIHLIPEEVSVARASELGSYRTGLPLYGIPFAIKDNIDLQDVATTAGCPAYSHIAGESAEVVRRLIQAGAIPIGKTNLDQFATGLVGTRSPYGACSSVFDRKYISGGSSSGSAVAVAAGLVSFALGTDTAGSGRIPASFNNIVGLKPTRGALSTRGLVPACRTLDCISIFTLTCADAELVYEVVQGFDADDPYSRSPNQKKAWPTSDLRVGVPSYRSLVFFGDDSGRDIFNRAVLQLEKLGAVAIEISYEPFRETAELLYSGPWVAERLAAIRDFLAVSPDSLHPVTAQIIGSAKSINGVDTFQAMYRLAELTRRVQKEFERIDCMLLPTAGACYTHEEVAAEPVRLNTNLGYYTNFVNLLDMAAVAAPFGRRANGISFGVSLLGPAWSEQALLQLADRLHRCESEVKVGADLFDLNETPAIAVPYSPEGYVALAVCGAHLSGQPLNSQLSLAGAFLIERTFTSDEYRLYALRGTVPAKPGLVKVSVDGSRIEVEVWAVPATNFGAFVAAVPPPLSIGSCILQSGRTVKSFLCEPLALQNADEITGFGGWLAYLNASNNVSR